jgi:pimeloyl-ACP methyl ester carboxylesterase
MSKLQIIYITGLGDREPRGQRRAISLWRFYGVEPVLFQTNWGDKQPWESKFKRLLGMIDEASADGKKVALVGVSAGAAAAINAYAARKDKIVGVVLIAGKVNRPQTVGEWYKRTNPAFVTAIQDCQKALASLSSSDLRKVMSRYSLADQRVVIADSQIKGAHNRVILGVGHFLTIALQITFGAPFIIRFLRQRAH